VAKDTTDAKREKSAETTKATKGKARVKVPLPPGLLSNRLAFAGAFVSGLLYWISFAGMDVWPLTFVAYAPLWIALQKQPPKRAFWLGAVAGTTMNVFGFYWLLNMLRTFSGFPTIACSFFVFVVCAYQGLRVGVMGWLYARATDRGWPRIPILFAAFVASELIYPLLFPWYYAATVHNVPLLTQAAELGGPILVGLVLLGANLAVAEPLLARLEKRAIRWPLVAGGFATVALELMFAIVRIPKVDALVQASEPVTVGVVQGNMGLLAKREDPAEGLRRHIRKTAELKAEGAELVIWSESSVTFAVPEDLAYSLMRARVGQHLGVPAIFGAVIYKADRKLSREQWYNVALSTNARGEVTARYDKEYLLQFGEHLPFSETFPILNEWSPNSGKFTPGTKLDPLVIVDMPKTNAPSGATASDAPREHKVAVLICYEDIIPAFTNALVNATHPELLVNITNDAWFGATTEPWEHLGLAQLRAIEHRRYLVRSTNSGVSAIVDPVGRVIAHTGVHDVQQGSFGAADALHETVRWMKSEGSTIYETIGDIPWWLISLSVVACAFVSRTRARVPTSASNDAKA
jgi:apolipoprotein N-acyltransferase